MSQEQQQTENNLPQLDEVAARDIKIGDKDFVLVIHPDLSTDSYVPHETDATTVANNTILGISFLLMSRDQAAVDALVQGFYAQIQAAMDGPAVDLEQALAETSSETPEQ